MISHRSSPRSFKPCAAAVCLFSFLLVDATAQEPGAEGGRWDGLGQIDGLLFTESSAAWSKATEQAIVARTPSYNAYVPTSQEKPFSRLQELVYDYMNDKLHETMTRASKEAFANTPVPPDWELSFLDEAYTPFTSQSTDWYCPTYDCYISVHVDYASTDLLARLQRILKGSHKKWCIVVSGSLTRDSGEDCVLSIFHDQVIIPPSTAKMMSMPKPK